MGNQVDVMSRTYRIKTSDEGTGTAFVIDIENRQYLLTAKHVVKTSVAPFDILWRGNWESVPVELIGHCEGETDISVFSIDIDLPRMLYPEGRGLGFEPNLHLAENVLFYGFPYGLSIPLSSGNQMALVKQGIVSGFFGKSMESDSPFFIDGHNNPGFSGGPVVAIRNEEHKVAGVVSGYRYDYQKVSGMDSSGQPDESVTVGYLAGNTGIVVAYNIQSALDLISERDN